MSNYQPKKKYLSQLRHTAHNEDAVQSHQQSQFQQHVNIMSKQDGSLLMNQQVSYPLPPMNGLSNSSDTSQLQRNDSFKSRTCFSETRPPEDAPMMMSPADPNGYVRMQNSYQVDMYMQNSPNFLMGVSHGLSGYDPKKNRHHVEKMDSFMWSHNRNIPMQNDQCHTSYNHMFPSLEVSHMNSSTLSPMSPNVTGDSRNVSHDVISPRSISTSDEMSVLHIKEEISGTGGGDGEDDQSSRIISGQMMSSQLMTHQMPSNNMSPNLSKSFYHQDGGVARFSTNDREAGVSSSLSSNSALHRPLLTSSGRNKGSGKPLEPKHACQVCGDVAAGFHCGAYVCEACKKFFLRCLKTGRGVMFLCPKNSKCDITKETRSHCQRCRYQRCMDLGMYKPGREDDKKLKVDFRSIPCKVCKAPSSGFHFGAITCEGCKGFFRRMLKEQVHRKFVCSNDERCNIDSANRTTCKSCRFTKCINIGMTLEGTRLGRQSNSVKRGVIIQCLPNRHHLLNQRSLSLDTGASDSSPPTKSPTSHLNFDPNHPSTLRRLLSDAEASKRCQTIGDDEEDDDDDSGDDEIPNLQPYSSDDVFLRSSDSSSANVMTSSSNRCMTQQYGNGDHPPTPSQRLNFSGGNELGDFHDLQTPMQYNRGDDSSQPDVEMISAHLMDSNNKNLMIARSNSYLPLKSEPMEMTEVDGFIKTDVNFNPLLVPSDSSSQLGLERFNSGQSYPIDVIPSNIIHSNPRSAATHVHSQLGRELVNEFDMLGGRTGMTRPQMDGGRHLYTQPKLLFCNLVSAFKQLDDIWVRPAELEELMYCPATLNTIWKLVEIPFRHMVRVGVRFFKRVPGFSELSYMDRLRMCKDAIYPLWLVYHSNSFNMDTQDFSWFTATSKERDLILAYIDPLHSLVGHFRSVGFSLRSLHLNDVEISFLAAMTVLSSSDGSCLECPDAVFSLQDELLDAFFNYQQELINYNKDGSETEADSSSSTTRTSTRLAVMLARLAELKRANIEHCNVANQIIRSYPNIETGALWKEVFLGEALPLHPDSLTSDINSTDAHPSTS